MSSKDQPFPNPDALSPEMLDVALELWSQAGEAHYLPVKGGSMHPMLRDGDLVLVAPSREVKIGDVVVFRHKDELITHRILWINTNTHGECTLRTKGDHVLSLDAPISETELVGRVVAIRRGSRQLNLGAFGADLINKMMAILMRVQSGLYIHPGEEKEGWFSAGAFAVRKFLSIIFLRGGGLLMLASQSVFGRWTD